MSTPCQVEALVSDPRLRLVFGSTLPNRLVHPDPLVRPRSALSEKTLTSGSGRLSRRIALDLHRSVLLVQRGGHIVDPDSPPVCSHPGVWVAKTAEGRSDLFVRPALLFGPRQHREYIPRADREFAGLGRVAGASARVTGHVLRRSFGRLAYQAGIPVPTIQRIFGHVSIDQTLHYIGVGQEEMTEGFAVFDTHMREGMETVTPPSQRLTAF